MKDVSEQIRVGMKIQDPTIIKHLIYGLEDAANYQRQVGSIAAPNLTHSEFWEAIDKIKKALHKLAIGKGTAEAAHNSIRKALPIIPPQYWTLIDQYTPEANIYVKVALSTELDKEQALFLYNIFVKFSDDKNKLGKGNARNQAKTHLMAIQKLAQWFNETLGKRPSSKLDSLFYNYVRIFFENHTENKCIESYERHIKNALSYKWKTI